MTSNTVKNTFFGRINYGSLNPPITSGTALGLTTKGDLLGHDGTNSGRLGVGTNTQVLQADSTQTLGVKWANKSPLTGTGDLWCFSSSGGGTDARLAVGSDTQVLTADSGAIKGLSYKYITQFTTRTNGHLYSRNSRTGTQSIPNSTTTAFTFSTTSGEAMSPATRTGMYLFVFGCRWASSTATKFVQLRINGVTVDPGVDSSGLTGDVCHSGARYVPVNSGDTIELVGNQSSGGNLNSVNAWCDWIFIGGQ